MALSQKLALLLEDPTGYHYPLYRFVADGGSWSTAMEHQHYTDKCLEYEQTLIPKWSSQLKASLPKKSPSAEKHRQRLIDDLESAYAYLGVTDEEFQVILASLLAA